MDQMGPISSDLENASKVLANIGTLHGRFADLKSCNKVPLLKAEWMAFSGADTFYPPALFPAPLMQGLPDGSAPWPTFQKWFEESSLGRKPIDESKYPGACQVFSLLGDMKEPNRLVSKVVAVAR